MKLLFISLLLVLCFISSCASFHPKVQVSTNEAGNKVEKEKSSKTLGKGAVWELLSPDYAVLHFKNVENNRSVSLVMNKGINSHFLNSGHWELIGFDLDGISYKAMNVSKKFILNISSRVQTYSGSVLAECPRVTKKAGKYLKRMKFFDRYPFSSSYGLCEIVVGDNKDEVQRSLMKEKKFKSLNLQNGF
jgi:hypothetical protein